MKVAILFGILPYVAVAILVLGLAARWLLASRQPPARRRHPPRGGIAWLLLFLAHAAGLAFPAAVIAWNEVAWRLYVLEGISFVLGVAALTACVGSVRRCFVRPARLPAEIADMAFFSLLLNAVVSGLALALLYRWGSSWAAVTLTPYVTSIARGAPETDFVAEMPFLIQLHVFTAFAALALLPFTSPALVAIVAIRRAIALRGTRFRSGRRSPANDNRRRT